MRIKFKVNPQAFDREITSSMSRKNTVKAFERNLKTTKGELLIKRVEELKKEMIKDFLKHPITVEILGGPTASNSSGTLGGYGNLFSFIGFGQSDRPIDPIVGLLEKTSFSLTRMNSRGQMRMVITLPSPQDIFSVTPLPWAPGISWAKRMEVGLSGLGMYLNKDSSISRSGSGIQSNHPIRTGKFSNSAYISRFINDWKNRFLKIDKAVKIT
tara:strand:- start:525 stop:1163 length:639 start_codon:yes stop_codon:yes gene_type:complete